MNTIPWVNPAKADWDRVERVHECLKILTRPVFSDDVGYHRVPRLMRRAERVRRYQDALLRMIGAA